MAAPDKLPGSATSWAFSHYITGVAVDCGAGVAAFALGTGRVRLVPFATQAAHISKEVRVHDGATLILAALPGGGFVTGGDDGALKYLKVNGAVEELARHPGKWIEQLVVLPDGAVAYGLGRSVRLLKVDGTSVEMGPHASTVSGLSGDAKQLIVGHYNGVTLWDPATGEPSQPPSLVWNGSHIFVTLSPDRRHIATAMQGGEIHGWRLSDLGEMRMSGYPGKIRSLVWAHDGSLLVTAGAELLVGWPFDGPGPEGRPPVELFDGASDSLITQVAAHPARAVFAGGYDDGRLALADRQGGSAVVPVTRKAAVTAMSWSADGQYLCVGTEDGKGLILSDDRIQALLS